MGLDITHNAFHGSYSSFNRLRKDIAEVWGGSYPPHSDPKLDNRYVYFPENMDEQSGMAIFMGHSDCDGEISSSDCKKVADELEEILPKLKHLDNGLRSSYSILEQFINGCRLAHSNNETLEFG